jgi:hypothetical protein
MLRTTSLPHAREAGSAPRRTADRRRIAVTIDPAVDVATMPVIDDESLVLALVGKKLERAGDKGLHISDIRWNCLSRTAIFVRCTRAQCVFIRFNHGQPFARIGGYYAAR